MLAYLVPQDEILLVNLLQGKRLPRFFVPDEVDGSVGTVRHQLDRVEVVLGGLLERRILALLFLDLAAVGVVVRMAWLGRRGSLKLTRPV